MEWNLLVDDQEPWVMYRVFVAGLVYIYVQDAYKVFTASYVLSSFGYIVSFGIPWMEWHAVHHMFTYPTAALIGVFLAKAVNQGPSPHPVLHILSILPWMTSGFYGPIGYPIFTFAYIIPLLIAKMFNWALVAGLSMTLTGIAFPLHSPMVSLTVPVCVLLVYGLFFDIYHDTPFELDV